MSTKSILDKAYGNVPKDVNSPLTNFSVEEYSLKYYWKKFLKLFHK